jgi:hypothetical protein
MPPFKVRIEGDGLEPVTAALGSAHIDYYGPGGAGYESQESWETASFMHAVVEAETPEEAEARVKDNLPEGDFTVAPAEPLGPSD